MTERRPVDLARVRASLARLDKLAAEHPELVTAESQRRLARDLPELLREDDDGKDGHGDLATPAVDAGPG